MTLNNEPVLTQDETAAMDLFCASLPDMGVQSALVEVVLKRTNNSKAAARNFGTALQDVMNTASDTMQDAGVSLKIVVEVAKASEIFPDGFVPSDEVVEKCGSAFWEAKRQAATDPNI